MPCIMVRLKKVTNAIAEKHKPIHRTKLLIKSLAKVALFDL